MVSISYTRTLRRAAPCYSPQVFRSLLIVSRLSLSDWPDSLLPDFVFFVYLVTVYQRFKIMLDTFSLQVRYSVHEATNQSTIKASGH